MRSNLFFMVFLLSISMLFSCIDTYIENPDYSGETTDTISNESDSTSIDIETGNSSIHEDSNDYQWDDSSVVNITLDGNTITVNGTGATANGSTVTITAAGNYNISGSLSNGQIVVNTEDESEVRLILNNAEINSSSGAPIYVVKSDETIIVLADNTTNKITDKHITVDAITTDVPNAAIYSMSDLTIYGNGKLVVESENNDGIASKDGLIIRGATIEVIASDDGIRGKDYLVVKSGTITIDAGGDGMKSDNEDDTAKGFITVETGTIKITSDGDAFAAQTDVQISGGKIELTSGGGGNKTASSTISSKGIKGVANVKISGGELNLSCADDAIHSNGNVFINGGEITISTSDDGVHADSTLTFNGGNTVISKSYEGIESAIITLNNGTIHLTSSDDGLNCASGAESGGMGGGFPGQTSSGSNYLYVNGGYLYMNAGGDGVDVNGSVEMTSGTIIVNGPTENMNAPLDYDGTYKISGGFVVAAGSSGMSMAPGTTSTQYSVLINFTSAQQGGSLVHFETSTGEDVLTFKPAKNYQSMALSSSKLVKGTTYNVYVGGSATGTVTDGIYTESAYSSGTKYTNFTISSVVTKLGSTSGPGGR